MHEELIGRYEAEEILAKAKQEQADAKIAAVQVIGAAPPAPYLETQELIALRSENRALKIENLTLRLDAMQKLMADPLLKERETLFAQARQQLGATPDQTEWNFETRQFQAPKA